MWVGGRCEVTFLEAWFLGNLRRGVTYAVLCKLTEACIVDFCGYSSEKDFWEIFAGFSGIFQGCKMAICSKNEAIHFSFIFYPRFFVQFIQSRYTLPLKSSEGSVLNFWGGKMLE